MRTEKTLTILFILGLLLKFLHIPGGGVLLVISLSSISLLYFPGAFYFFSDKSIKRQNITLSVISGLFLSVIVIGLLFKLQYWPGAKMYLFVGTIVAPLILGIVHVLKSKAREELQVYYKNMILRTTIITILTIIFYLIPTETLLKIQYWNDPELARLKSLHYTYPEVEEYKKQHDEYIFKKGY